MECCVNVIRSIFKFYVLKCMSLRDTHDLNDHKTPSCSISLKCKSILNICISDIDIHKKIIKLKININVDVK